MDFNFTDEQSMLRDTVASYLADHYSFDQRRAMLAKEPHWSPATWKAFAEELGILGAPFSEELGGLVRRRGGAQQYLLPNRSLWSAPVLVGTIKN